MGEGHRLPKMQPCGSFRRPSVTRVPREAKNVSTRDGDSWRGIDGAKGGALARPASSEATLAEVCKIGIEKGSRKGCSGGGLEEREEAERDSSAIGCELSGL